MGRWGGGDRGGVQDSRFLLKSCKWLVGHVTCIYFKDNSIAFLKNGNILSKTLLAYKWRGS